MHPLFALYLAVGLFVAVKFDRDMEDWEESLNLREWITIILLGAPILAATLVYDFFKYMTEPFWEFPED